MIRRKIINKISTQFGNILGYELNLKKPQTFNEKLQWLKVYYRDPRMTQCADKYQVHQYVKETVGEKFLTPIVGVYSSSDEINIDTLPKKFALKATNGSGTNIICKDKKSIDIKIIREITSSWLKPESSHYFYSYEWCYKNIKPKVICEQYIDTGGEQLIDYKFLCFNGEVKMLFVCTDRDNALKIDFFDLDWNKLPFSRHYPNSNKKINKPKNLKKMISLAEKLSKPFPFVRVDLFEINESIRFSELTFYPANGMGKFTPHEWDKNLGDMLQLPRSVAIGNIKRYSSWYGRRLLKQTRSLLRYL